MAERAVASGGGVTVRGVVVVGIGPYDFAPILGVPAVLRAARVVVDLVGNVTFSGPPDACAQAARLCAGLLVREVGHADVVLMHDACRPFAPVTVATAVLDAVLGGESAAVPVLPLTDTVKQVGPDGALRAAADRATLRVVQAPVAFRPARLTGAPCDALDLVRLCAASGTTVCTVPGDAAAAALRTAWDLDRAALANIDRIIG